MREPPASLTATVPAVEVLSAHKTYGNGTVALQPVHLTVQEGEFVTLLGPSGCGKSTLLKMVAGLLEPTDGKIVLWRKPVAALDEITRHKLDGELLQLWQAKKLTVVFVTHSIHEAVFLSNRVVMMAARPGRIVDEVVIDEPYPRTPDFMVTPRFAEYAKRLQDSLLRVSQEADEEAGA